MQVEEFVLGYSSRVGLVVGGVGVVPAFRGEYTCGAELDVAYARRHGCVGLLVEAREELGLPGAF